MAATTSKPRSARAAASQAASVTKSTAAKQHTSGNASGERKANAAQTRRRTAAAKSSANGSPSSSNGNGGSASAGSSKAKASSNGAKAGSTGAKAGSNGAKASSTRSKPTSTRAKSGSTRAKTATTSRTKTAASKPKDAAPKPNGSASKPKAAAPKPKGPARKPKTAPPPKGIETSANDDQKDKTSTTKRKKPDVKKPESKDKGENPVTSGGKHLASALFSSTSHKPGKKHPVAKALAKRTAKHVVKSAGRRSLKAGGAALRTVAETAGTAGRQAARAGMSRVVDHRPPVQASVDVAAPIAVVWDEWMTFEWFTEGLHQIEDVERDGDELAGRVASAHDRDWHAEIVDEREQQAFAWRSDEGTDCAGLVTFHRLSDRLTRIEADLDVLPTTPGETFLLSLPVPARRAERALQLFKAHVEFIDPDSYEDELEDFDESSAGQGEPQAESDRGEETEGHSDNDGAEEDAENDD